MPYAELVAEGAKGSILAKRKAVIVVEDDPAMLKGVERLLKVHGFDALLFDSVEDFQEHASFDKAFCMVLDINLNGQSGIELRRRIAASGISIPVIFITANDSEAIRAAALESGCLAYLAKPFSAKSLIDPIERASSELRPC